MAYDAHGVPVRRGVARQFTLDVVAVEALEEMASGPKTQGRLISELLIGELCRREERARLRQVLLDALAVPPDA